MKKLFTIIVFALLSIAYTNAQNSELWGMTSNGGHLSNGIIFKTDGSGNNQSVVYSFQNETGGRPDKITLCEASNGKLYGTTLIGGIHNRGIIFEYDPTTDTYTKKYDFDGNIGLYPQGSLIQATNGKLYGMTSSGGQHNCGVIFEYDPTTNTCTSKYDFDSDYVNNGSTPTGSLIQASNGKLYGLTEAGGAIASGIIFEYDLTTNTFTKKYDFDGNNGSSPQGSLIQASNGKLYGITSSGGASNNGVIFEYDIATNTYTKKLDFDGNNGSSPQGSLMQASNGKLYGLTSSGGASNNGVIFEYDITTNTYTKKLDLDENNGSHPYGSLMQASNGKLYGLTSYSGANNNGVLFEYDPATDTYIKKLDFDGNNGSSPRGSLMQASNGKLYGLTPEGGASCNGVIFEYDITTDIYTQKYDFDGCNSTHPYGSLMQASNGKLYAMTPDSGLYGYGTIFEYNIVTNTYTKKLDFDENNGSYPYGSLIQATNGKLYGTTSSGGQHYYGVIFEYDLTCGTYNIKLDFDGNNGSYPYGSLIQASNGKLYGLTSGGGAYNNGVIFEYDPATDTYIKKLDFDENNGSYPYGSLIQASNGKLYGLTSGGGAYNNGVIFEYDPATDIYTKKLDFDGNNGGEPYGSLIQATNGKLYGMTSRGGASNKGVIFEYDLTYDTYNIKLDFDGNNGAYPKGSLLQASNNNIYGMTTGGGANNRGVLFEYDPATDIYTKKLDFNGTNGDYPIYTALIEIYSNTTNVINNKSFKNIQIYPNPSKGEININLGELKEVSLNVFDATGKKVLSKQNINQKIYKVNLNQPAGFYIIELNSNNKIQRYKLVIN